MKWLRMNHSIQTLVAFIWAVLILSNIVVSLIGIDMIEQFVIAAVQQTERNLNTIRTIKRKS